MKILLTGGGTAGHVVPHLALLNGIRKNYDKIIYIGSKTGIEKDIIAKQNDITYYPITTTKFVRNKLFTNLLIPFKLIGGVYQAKKIIKKEKPNIVFSKGGYVSLPVVYAAKRLKVPVVAHESDLYMGLANKLSLKSATVLCTTFEKTASQIKNKGVYTGSPIREEQIKSKAEGLKQLGINTSKPILVITGGSLGSRFINNKIREEIKPITDRFYCLHLTGRNNIDPALSNIKDYKQLEFVSDMGSVLTCADVVVSRAGSNTIFELAFFKKPMLLIPLPKGNSRGDQVDNANYFNQKGYANFVTEDQLASSPILPYIMQTFNESARLKQTLEKANIKPANDKLLEIILKYSKKEWLWCNKESTNSITLFYIKFYKAH